VEYIHEEDLFRVFRVGHRMVSMCNSLVSCNFAADAKEVWGKSDLSVFPNTVMRSNQKRFDGLMSKESVG
jgi:hypothetical protein